MLCTFSKSTLFMLSELHKTFIHPEFIVFIASKFLCVIYVLMAVVSFGGVHGKGKP